MNLAMLLISMLLLAIGVEARPGGGRGEGGGRLLSDGAAPAYPSFESHEALRTYLKQRDIRYLDLGASLGGSRRMIEGLVRKAEPAAAAQEQLVLGLDISDAKLRVCNAGGKAMCAKADLRRLFASHGARPVVDGISMVDILEHINLPVADAAHVPPHRLRQLHGESFDTASHTAAVELWDASCAAAKKFCFMMGPSFDAEASLRELGFMRYYEAWSAHTCHLNSTSLTLAMTGSRDSRPGASLVMLETRMPSSSSKMILRQPPAEVDRQCSARNVTRFVLGCEQGPDSHSKKPPLALRYPNNGPAVDLRALDIFRAMYGLRTFHHQVSGLSRTAAMLIHKYATKKDSKVVHCSLSSRAGLSGAACVQALIDEATERLRLP